MRENAKQKMTAIRNSFETGEAWLRISRFGGGTTLFLFALYLVEKLH